MSIKTLICSIFAATLAASCSSDPPVPQGRIRVKNDSMDSSYNVVRVSAGGRSYALKPGEFALLPKGVSNIRFSRQYADHVKAYTVKCPSKLTEGIQIKLIDVHLNRMPGGCSTIEASQ